ncbi:PaaI family thioesterase [Hydrogenophaga sp.]|uniref:PaaI family thioesterase n=1 Tax=Hydrogenophaga sp. TaxID=1904254 RepID=UPI002FC95CB6
MSCPTPALADVLEEPASDTSQLFQQVAFNHLLGLRRELAEGGVSRLALDLRDELTNNFGNAHGGVLMTMLDGAMTSAALSHSGFQRAAMTIDMSTQFHKPGRGRLVAHGRATRAGQSICFCEAQVEDESGDVVAKAVGTFKFMRLNNRVPS